MTVEKLTGDTCFVSSLRRNGRFYSSPSSLSSIWFYFSVFSTFLFFFFLFLPPVNRKGEGIGGDRQEHVKLGGRVRGRSPVRSCFSVRVCAGASACVCSRACLRVCVEELLSNSIINSSGFCMSRLPFPDNAPTHTHARAHAHCLSHTHTVQ